jgi:hypothetical protein
MSLGASGPPATPKQLKYLASLLDKAGFPTWRDARRPYGLTQRQGSGKFTKREASELIDRLVAAENGEEPTDDGAMSAGFGVSAALLDTAPDRAEVELAATRQEVVRGLPADVIADELRRRGWTVSPPPD